jgi:hypothetical protein
MALVPGVAHGMARTDTHHLRLDEQGMLERGLRRVACVLRVVGVHEQVAAGLQFAPDAAGGLQRKRAGAGARDQRDRDAGRFDERAGAPHLAGGMGNGLAALLDTAQVLGAAMVGLKTGESQGSLCINGVGQRHGSLARRHPAAALADVDLDKDVNVCTIQIRPGASCAVRIQGPAQTLAFFHRLGQPRDAVQAVHRDREPPANGIERVPQRRHATQLGRCDDLVADKDIAHAARGQRLGLGRLLHAHAHGARLHLQPRQRRALVHLGVRAQPDLVFSGELGHARDVALHRVEVDHQRGGVDGGHVLADQRRQHRRQGRCGGVRWRFHRGSHRPGARCPTSPPATGHRASIAGG